MQQPSLWRHTHREMPDRRPGLVRSRARIWTLAGLALSVALLAACSDDTPGPAAAALDCRLPSDCPVGQTCEQGACVELTPCSGDDCPCLADADCDDAQWCDLARGACRAAQCSGPQDCPLGTVCESSRCLTDLAADRDRDGIPDREDSCPEVANAQDQDTDDDGRGDLCDEDDDGDGIPDALDRCPRVRDPEQFDADADGIGNACDDDWAGVTITGSLVTFDALEPDFTRARVTLAGHDTPATPDADGRFVFEGAIDRPGPVGLSAHLTGFAEASVVIVVPDGATRVEAPPITLTVRPVPITGQVHLDGEPTSGRVQVAVRQQGRLSTIFATTDDGSWGGTIAPVDAELEFSHPGFLSQRLVDGQPLEDIEVVLRRDPLADRDGDDRVDLFDNCPLIANLDQADLDEDGLGDACDADRDGDGVADPVDLCPEVADPDQRDPDGDGRGMACEGVDRSSPWRMGRRLVHLRADTRTRPNDLRGSCGGARAPELVFEVHLESGERLRAEANATFTAVWYVLDDTRAEQACGATDPFVFEAPRAGLYTVVLDGLTGADQGTVDVSISRSHRRWFSLASDLDLGDALAAIVPIRLNQANAELLALEPGAGRIHRLRTVDERFDVTRLAPLESVQGLGRPVAAVTFPRAPSGPENLAVADEAGNRVVVLSSDPTDRLVEMTTVTVGDGPGAITSADLDADALPDLVVGNRRSGDLSILFGVATDPAAFDAATSVPLAFQATPTDIAVGDLDADGLEDLVVGVVTGPGDGFLMRLDGRSGRTFAPAVTLHTYRRGAPTLEIADLDGDGDADLLAGWESGALAVWTNDGRGELRLFHEVSTGLALRALALHDLDGDGDPDVLAAGDGGLLSLLNDGGGALTAAARHETFGDLRDAQVATPTEGFPPVLLTADAAGTLAVWASTSGLDVRRTFAPTDLGVGAGALLVGDLNGDEVPDLAPTGDDGSGQVSVDVAISDGRGSWTRTDVGCGGRSTLALGDVDGDGDGDIVSVTGIFPPYTLIVCRQDRGTFVEAGRTPLAELPHEARLAHMGPDRGTALIVALDRRVVAVPLSAQGAPSPPATIHDAPSPIAVADFDGDGVDEAILRVGASYARWSGAITPIVLRGTLDAGVTRIEVLDFDGDGRPDLVESGRDVGLVRVWTQRDDGSLAPIASAPVHAPLQEFGVVDLDGDGRRDIVVHTNDATSLVVWPGAGGGALGAPYSFPGSGPVAIGEVGGRWAMAVGGIAPTVVQEAPLLGLDVRRLAGIRSSVAPRAAFDDLDGDGLTDLVAVVNDSVLTAVAGESGPLTLITPLPAPPFPVDVSSLPPRRGALPDLVIATRDGRLHLARNFGDGAFDAPTTLTISAPADSRLASLDANGDGLLDLLAFGATGFGSTTRLLLRTSDGAFVEGTFPTPTPAPFAVVTGDLDRDGRDDAVLLQADLLGNGSVTRVLSGGPTGWTSMTTAQSGRPSAAWIGDLDLDGDADLAIVLESPTDGGPVELLLHTNDGAGGLSSPSRIALPFVAQAGSPPFGLSRGSYSITGLDLDDDGSLELLLSSDAASTMVVLSRLDGFAQPHLVPIPPTARLAPVHLDRSRRPDLGLVTTTGIATLVNTSGAEGQEAHLLDAPLPPCPPIDVDGAVTDHAITFLTGTAHACRIERVSLELEPVEGAIGDATLVLDTSLIPQRLWLGAIPLHRGPTNVSGRSHSALGLLAGAPAGGRWRLALPDRCGGSTAACGTLIANARLRFNAPIDDLTAAPRCDALDDAPDADQPPCAWDHTPLDGQLGDADDDTDHLALTRPLTAGTVVHLTLESSLPIDADLRLTGARHPLTRALTTAPGVQEATLLIDTRTAGRALSLVLASPGAPTDYTLQLDVVEPSR